MTKTECKKCEELMYEAIGKMISSNVSYKNYEILLKEDKIKAEIELRKADQGYGCAEGIYQALETIGFKHEDMKTLGDLL